MKKSPGIQWSKNPDKHDYPAALSFLSLIYEVEDAARLVKKLKRAKVIEVRATDIFRASGLSLLGLSNANVEKDKKKILDGTELSPLLLVRDSRNGRVIVADGYHRLCAVYSFNEEAVVPCKLI
jgi:hypothetical protein